MSAMRNPPTPEAAARQLEAVVRECVAAGVARQVLLLRLSALPRELAQPHHLRLAHEALEPLAGADRARLFVLPGGDAAMVWRGPAPGPLAASLERLRHLFADTGEAAPPLANVALHLVLPGDAGVLAALLAAGRPPLPDKPSPPRHKLDPATLAALEVALEQADLSRFVRRRAVCTSTPDGWRLAWERRQFCLRELAEALVPDHDLKAEPWLFRRLTRTLDRRMMALLAAPRELDQAPPFALRLNIGSVLSSEFLRFDGALPSRLRGRVLLELRPEDLMADVAAYLFARDFAQARGYRVLLGPMTAGVAAAFLPDAAGADHLRLVWRPRAAPDDAAPNGAAPDFTPLELASNNLAALDLAALGHPPGRVVLAGVVGRDGLMDPAAIEWARQQRVALVEAPLAAAPRLRAFATG